MQAPIDPMKWISSIEKLSPICGILHPICIWCLTNQPLSYTLNTLAYTWLLYQLQIACASHSGIPLHDISSSRQNHNIYYSEDEGRGSSASSNNYSSPNTSGSRPLSTSTTGSVSIKSIQRPPLPPLPSECAAQINLCLPTFIQIRFAPHAHCIVHVQVVFGVTESDTYICAYTCLFDTLFTCICTFVSSDGNLFDAIGQHV